MAFRIVSGGALPKGVYGNQTPAKDKTGEKFMAWQHELGVCCVSLIDGQPLEVHHLKVERGADGLLKSHNQLGKKNNDRMTVPLLKRLHREYSESLHKGNEAEWWRGHRIDPLAMCAALWIAFEQRPQDTDFAIAIMKACRGLDV